jgi:hypothetical protein
LIALSSWTNHYDAMPSDDFWAFGEEWSAPTNRCGGVDNVRPQLHHCTVHDHPTPRPIDLPEEHKGLGLAEWDDPVSATNMRSEGFASLTLA